MVFIWDFYNIYIKYDNSIIYNKKEKEIFIF